MRELSERDTTEYNREYPKNIPISGIGYRVCRTGIYIPSERGISKAQENNRPKENV
jgi:hypothetical protein